MLHVKYNIFILLFFLSACSITNYKHSKSKFITIKTKILKFSDLGYIKNTDNSIRLELFVAGNNIQNIEINNLMFNEIREITEVIFSNFSETYR